MMIKAGSGQKSRTGKPCRRPRKSRTNQSMVPRLRT